METSKENPDGSEVQVLYLKRGNEITVIYLPDPPAATWTRQPEERPGDYFFEGRVYITQGVAQSLTQLEIYWIIADLRRAVAEAEGLDYLQVFRSDDGRTVWIMDQLSRSMKQGGDYTPEQIEEYDHFTILLPEEH